MATEVLTTSKGVYFITFTCHNWMPLIDITNAYSAVYKFFTVLRSKGHSIVGYVIMPNHIHFIIKYNGGQTLNTLIGNGKRFLAYEIIQKLQDSQNIKVLSKLQDAVDKKDRSRGKLHQVWRRGFEIKECRTEKFLLQKLNYIHENPIKGKWNLSSDRQSYTHSSCLYYLKGIQQHFEVTNYESVLDWESMYE